MPLIVVILECVTLLTVATYGMALVYALLYRDGTVWNVFRWNILFAFLASFGSLISIHYLRWDKAMEAPVIIGIVLVNAARFGCAVTTGMLAFHIKAMVEQGK